MNKDKIIVSLCGGTGAWEKYYKENEGKELERIIIDMSDLTRNIFNGWRPNQGEIIGNKFENPELLKEI